MHPLQPPAFPKIPGWLPEKPAASAAADAATADATLAALRRKATAARRWRRLAAAGIPNAAGAAAVMRGGGGGGAGMASRQPVMQGTVGHPIGCRRRRKCHCRVLFEVGVIDVGVIEVVDVAARSRKRPRGSAPGRTKATVPSPGMPRSAAYMESTRPG